MKPKSRKDKEDKESRKKRHQQKRLDYTLHKLKYMALRDRKQKAKSHSNSKSSKGMVDFGGCSSASYGSVMMCQSSQSGSSSCNLHSVNSSDRVVCGSTSMRWPPQKTCTRKKWDSTKLQPMVGLTSMFCQKQRETLFRYSDQFAVQSVNIGERKTNSNICDTLERSSLEMQTHTKNAAQCSMMSSIMAPSSKTITKSGSYICETARRSSNMQSKNIYSDGMTSVCEDVIGKASKVQCIDIGQDSRLCRVAGSEMAVSVDKDCSANMIDMKLDGVAGSSSMDTGVVDNSLPKGACTTCCKDASSPGPHLHDEKNCCQHYRDLKVRVRWCEKQVKVMREEVKRLKAMSKPRK